MGQKAADEVLGFEYDWLAADANGSVALFSTAGGGYAPDDFLRDIGAHDAAIDAILALPALTRASSALLPAEGLYSWLRVAERGIFVFDSDVHGGPYRLILVPETPIRADDLPGAAAAVVAKVVFRHLRFSVLREVTKEVLQQAPPSQP